jgi:hypothetical protein
MELGTMARGGRSNHGTTHMALRPELLYIMNTIHTGVTIRSRNHVGIGRPEDAGISFSITQLNPMKPNGIRTHQCA